MAYLGNRGESSLEPWLCTIARNRCLTRLDTAKRNKATPGEDGTLEIPDTGPGPDDRLHGEQLRVAAPKPLNADVCCAKRRRSDLNTQPARFIQQHCDVSRCHHGFLIDFVPIGDFDVSTNSPRRFVTATGSK